MKNALLMVLAFVVFSSCSNDKKNENIDTPEQNEADIVAYIAANNLDAIKSESGLYYVINEPGTGEQPVTSSDVTVAYKGYFLDGSVFDQSDENGITFPLSRVIKGWTEGIAYFKEGGSGMLLIPAQLGYGNSGSGPIPGGSVLLFDIKLLEVK